MEVQRTACRTVDLLTWSGIHEQMLARYRVCVAATAKHGRVASHDWTLRHSDFSHFLVPPVFSFHQLLLNFIQLWLAGVDAGFSFRGFSPNPVRVATGNRRTGKWARIIVETALSQWRSNFRTRSPLTTTTRNHRLVAGDCMLVFWTITWFIQFQLYTLQSCTFCRPIWICLQTVVEQTWLVTSQPIDQVGFLAGLTGPPWAPPFSQWSGDASCDRARWYRLGTISCRRAYIGATEWNWGQLVAKKWNMGRWWQLAATGGASSCRERTSTETGDWLFPLSCGQLFSVVKKFLGNYLATSCLQLPLPIFILLHLSNWFPQLFNLLGKNTAVSESMSSLPRTGSTQHVLLKVKVEISWRLWMIIITRDNV